MKNIRDKGRIAVEYMQHIIIAQVKLQMWGDLHNDLFYY